MLSDGEPASPPETASAACSRVPTHEKELDLQGEPSASAAALEEYNRRHREAQGQRPPQRRKAQRRRRRQGQGQGQGIPEPLEPPPLQGMVVDSVASHEGEEDPGSVVLGVLV